MQEMKETWVRSLGQEDPLEKGRAYPLQYCVEKCLFSPLAHFFDWVIYFSGVDAWVIYSPYLSARRDGRLLLASGWIADRNTGVPSLPLP